MTLPVTTILPVPKVTDDPELEKYLNELTSTLQQQYEDIAQATNGSIKNNAESGGNSYIPVLQGSTPGTFTYTHQIGWILRKGLMVDVWGDILWSAATATGDLFVKLPYKAAISAQMPFVGVVQPIDLAYTAGTSMVINSSPDTYNGYFFNIGNGLAESKQQVAATGRLIFHLRYLGQGIER